MRVIDVRQLEYFVAVAEELSFTRAARRCHVVQSGLSAQIAKLEKDCGIQLFERTSRSVVLAPGGAALLPRAREILAGLDAAQAELAAVAGVLTGHLRLGLIGSATATPVVQQALSDFHTRHPGVQITIDDTGSADMAERVRSGALDLAFVGLFPAQLPGDLTHRVLAEEPLVLLVPNGHRLSAGRDPVDLAEADQEHFVDMRPEAGLRRQVDAAVDRAGVTRRVAFELSTSDHVARLVELGLGLALLPATVATDRTAVVRTLRDQAAAHPVTVVHRTPRPGSPAARAFLRLLDDNPSHRTAVAE